MGRCADVERATQAVCEMLRSLDRFLAAIEAEDFYLAADELAQLIGNGEERGLFGKALGVCAEVMELFRCGRQPVVGFGFWGSSWHDLALGIVHMVCNWVFSGMYLATTEQTNAEIIRLIGSYGMSWDWEYKATRVNEGLLRERVVEMLKRHAWTVQEYCASQSGRPNLALLAHFVKQDCKGVQEVIECVGEDNLPIPPMQAAGNGGVSRHPRAGQRTIDERMKLTLERRSESREWTVDEWMTNLKCSRGGITGTETYKTLAAAKKLVRAQEGARRLGVGRDRRWRQKKRE